MGTDGEPDGEPMEYKEGLYLYRVCTSGMLVQGRGCFTGLLLLTCNKTSPPVLCTVRYARHVLQGYAKADLYQVLGSSVLAHPTRILPSGPFCTDPAVQILLQPILSVTHSVLLYQKASVCSSVLSDLFTLKMDAHLEN